LDLDLKRPDGGAIADWRAWSPPKDLKHWRPGRSAVELARAWFTAETPRIPPEFAALLASSPLLAGLGGLKGVPEHVTSLPEAGEGRNHDLVLEGEAAGGRVLIAVEAKADEKFGPRIGKYWAQTREERSAPGGTPSRAPERIEALLVLLAGPEVLPTQDPWNRIRYQLLTAAVGALLEAQTRKASLAVLAIHEFRTSETDENSLDRNAADLEAFLAALGLLPAAPMQPGILYGPWQSPEIPIPLLIGKATYDWRAV
jgi:hypothetical protein